MRITQNMILRNTLQSINNSRDGMNRSQSRISSQKRVEKPSDDPISFSRAARYRRNLDQNKQFIRNVQDAKSWVDTSSIALDQLHEYTLQAYDYTMQGADGTSDAEIRSSLADSMRGLLQEMVGLGNSQYLGKSIFAGTATSESEPFELQSDTVTYHGDDEHIQRRVGENLVLDINTTGQELMDSQIFDVMSGLITALDANDITGIETGLDNLNAVKDKILTISTNVATRATSLTLIKDRLTSTNVNLQAHISDEEDTVMEEEIVKFKSQETAYQAALKSASEIMQMNILNYLS